MDSQDLLGLTADVVSAFLAHNRIEADALPALIGAVHRALDTAGTASSPPVALTPAVPVRQSIKHDHIVCLEDGMRLKSLRRHLTASHGLTPEAYRARWGLPPDYPMVAPDYAALRSEMAKQIGLGMRKPTAEPVAAPQKAASAKAAPGKAGTSRSAAVKPAQAKPSPARTPARAASIEPPPESRTAHRNGADASPAAESRARREPTAASVFANFQGSEPRPHEPEPPAAEDASAALFAGRRKPFAKQSARGMKQGKPATTRRSS